MITLRLLGCSGGIGGTGRRTTCYGLDDTVLIDAGTGAGELSLEHMARIDHIVLTHAHLDHIACLPLLLDSVAASRETPLQIWALPAVIDILRAHVFNDQIWPCPAAMASLLAATAYKKARSPWLFRATPSTALLSGKPLPAIMRLLP